MTSALAAIASASPVQPLAVVTPVARSPSVSIEVTGSPSRITPPSRSNCVTMPATNLLVPPIANQTPPSRSSLWISA